MSPRPLALLLSATLALGALACVTPAVHAAPRVTAAVSINVAPPAPQFERMPPPRAGYVWAPGYWVWNARARRYVWTNGRWLRARRGYRYAPPGWRQGPRGNWHFRAGAWTR